MVSINIKILVEFSKDGFPWKALNQSSNPGMGFGVELWGSTSTFIQMLNASKTEWELCLMAHYTVSSCWFIGNLKAFLMVLPSGKRLQKTMENHHC